MIVFSHMEESELDTRYFLRKSHLEEVVDLDLLIEKVNHIDNHMEKAKYAKFYNLYLKKYFKLLCCRRFWSNVTLESNNRGR